MVFHPDAHNCDFIKKCPNIESVDVWDRNPKEGRLYTIEGSNAIFEYVYNDNSVLVKGNEVIAGCKNSKIPSDGSVTSIGDSAFYECKNLTSITIPDGVTSIGSGAFEFCYKRCGICKNRNS